MMGNNVTRIGKCRVWFWSMESNDHRFNSATILSKRNPEGSRADLDYPDSWDTPFTRTKRFWFKVFRYKVSTLDSGFITFLICDESGNSCFVCYTEMNPVLKRPVFVIGPDWLQTIMF